VEVTCLPSLITGNLSDYVQDIAITCTKTLQGQIFSAIRNGDNATLSSLLTSDTTDVITASVDPTGKYAIAPKILDQKTSVYLYANYLTTQYAVQSTGLAMLDTLNAALEGVIAKAIKGAATRISLTFTHDPATHQILQFYYAGRRGGGT